MARCGLALTHGQSADDDRSDGGRIIIGSFCIRVAASFLAPRTIRVSGQTKQCADGQAATFHDVILYTHDIFNERDQGMTGLTLSRLNKECGAEK
jgi:hypothetical protein